MSRYSWEAAEERSMDRNEDEIWDDETGDAEVQDAEARNDGARDDPHGERTVSAAGDLATVVCPYCFESVQILLEPEISGELVWDCEVCCNPWQLKIRRAGGFVGVDAERLQ